MGHFLKKLNRINVTLIIFIFWTIDRTSSLLSKSRSYATLFYLYFYNKLLCEDQRNSRAEKYSIQLPTCTRRRLARMFGPFPSSCNSNKDEPVRPSVTFYMLQTPCNVRSLKKRNEEKKMWREFPSSFNARSVRERRFCLARRWVAGQTPLPVQF